MKKINGKVKNKKGFTLVEIVVVIAIIAVLSLLVIGAITVARNAATEATNRQNAQTLRLALEAHHARHAVYCGTGTGMIACTTSPISFITLSQRLTTAQFPHTLRETRPTTGANLGGGNITVQAQRVDIQVVTHNDQLSGPPIIMP